MPLDEWQDQAFEAAMGERADGRWSSKFVGISAPRQNGKSQVIVARALAGILLFGEKMIIISAHETDTAREVWKRLIDVVESNPTLEARVTGRMDAINREYLAFGEGMDRQTIKLKARRSSGARGFSADCLLLDEAQILGKAQWGSIVPTMSARENPQMWLFGTPPTEDDDPFAFSRVRESALSSKARHCWLEWSAAPGDDLDAVETWAKANPSFGVRITEEACADDRAAMDDQQFARERLGMWDEEIGLEVISASVWNALAAEGPDVDVPPDALAVDMDHKRQMTFAACWRGDERTHVELIDEQPASDTSAAADWIAERAGTIPVVLFNGGATASLLPLLAERGVNVVSAGVTDMGRACGLFLDEVLAGRVSHATQPELSTSVTGARQKWRGEAGAWTWDFKNSLGPMGPVVGVTMALWGAISAAPEPVQETEVWGFFE